jgi:hypothetical protein
MESIAVPVTISSLAAAISHRVERLTADSPAGDILALIRLTEALDVALDRLALALDVTSIKTVAA